jgi:RNA polymerase sigma factor (sigma-70 family)
LCARLDHPSARRPGADESAQRLVVEAATASASPLTLVPAIEASPAPTGTGAVSRSGGRRLSRRDLTEMELTDLVALAGDGESRAWDELVRRFERLVLATARKCGLSNDDADDVSQTVWMRLLRHLKGINDPEHLGGWLITTTGREAVALSTRNRREREINARCSELGGRSEAACEDQVLAVERRQTVRRAVDRLAPNGARLLRLVGSGESSYASAAAELGVSVGTIGPARQRLLRTLSRSPELAAVR